MQHVHTDGYIYEYSVEQESLGERYGVPKRDVLRRSILLYDFGRGPQVDMILQDCAEDWSKNVDLGEWRFPLTFCLWKTPDDDERVPVLLGKAEISMEYEPSFSAKRI